jgi:hypothetical protein
MTTNFEGGSATTSFPASGRLSGKEEVVAFPIRLQTMLRKESVQRPLVVQWSLDGRAFFVDDEEQFVAGILPLYNFQQTAMATFEAITTSF